MNNPQKRYCLVFGAGTYFGITLFAFMTLAIDSGISTPRSLIDNIGKAILWPGAPMIPNFYHGNILQAIQDRRENRDNRNK
jgi:hypothetical protein